MDDKFFLRSARVWAAVCTIAGVVMPFAGLDPTQGVPILEKIGEQGLATAGAVLLLVHFIRPAVERLRARPKGPGDAAALAGGLALAAAILACTSYNGSSYLELARIEEGRRDMPLRAPYCEAQEIAALVLATGADQASKLPLGRGFAIDRLRAAHTRQAAYCWRALALRAEGRLTAESEQRLVAAWRRQWIDGAAIVTGHEAAIITREE